MWVGGQRRASAALPLGKTRYSLYRRLGGPQGRSGQGAENLALTEIRSPDRPARNESLYRLSYPGPRERTPVYIELASGWAPEPVSAFRRREESYAPTRIRTQVSSP